MMLEGFDKAFENRARLGIMSMLMVNEWINFTEIKELMGLSDGNIASHIAALEKVNYIEVKKVFIGKKPNTSYAATLLGKEAFKKHITALGKLIK